MTSGKATFEIQEQIDGRTTIRLSVVSEQQTNGWEVILQADRSLTNVHVRKILFLRLCGEKKQTNKQIENDQINKTIKEVQLFC